MNAWVPLADADADGCVCDEYGPDFCDWPGDHIEEAALLDEVTTS